ncbi:hypothetical protein Q5530_13360 [Saccharothrix sp. BKS2]|uniref:hypothetical protein n=1 Tax=Saccharothrix sp. BKS2 TaxID=3064400 RepID=UPI0039ECDC52
MRSGTPRSEQSGGRATESGGRGLDAVHAAGSARQRSRSAVARSAAAKRHGEDCTRRAEEAWTRMLGVVCRLEAALTDKQAAAAHLDDLALDQLTTPSWRRSAVLLRWVRQPRRDPAAPAVEPPAGSEGAPGRSAHPVRRPAGRTTRSPDEVRRPGDG